MRELMFRADTKAKRLAKIKSKTYRRLKKKRERKVTEKLGVDEDSADEEKELQREVERARERATLKHKNTGKWARAMKARGELDEDQRQEVLEMLQRSEKLRRKIHAKGDEEEEDSDDDTGDEDQVRASAFDEVAKLTEEGPEHPKKSLFSMKFMKDAMARDNKRAQDMADEFLKDLAGSDAEIAPDSDDNTKDRPVGVVGRFSFRPGAQVGVVTLFRLETLVIPTSDCRLNPQLWISHCQMLRGIWNLSLPFHPTRFHLNQRWFPPPRPNPPPPLPPPCPAPFFQPLFQSPKTRG